MPGCRGSPGEGILKLAVVFLASTQRQFQVFDIEPIFASQRPVSSGQILVGIAKKAGAAALRVVFGFMLGDQSQRLLVKVQIGLKCYAIPRAAAGVGAGLRSQIGVV